MEIAVPVEHLPEFWRGVYPFGMTLQDVSNELSDFEFVMKEVPKVYEYATGGAASKIMTHASAINGLIDDEVNRQIEYALDEELKSIKG